jgi:CDP-glycerol glycerophosphotransferase (TagB/SpsB family)
MRARRVFISADHGLAIVYFLQSDVVPTLLEAGVEVVLLTDDGLVDQISRRFGRPGLVVEGLRLPQARAYAERVSPERQWWLGFLRRVGSSDRINTAAMDSYVEQVAAEEPNRRRLLMPLAWLTIAVMRRSRAARRRLVGAQRRFTSALYGDLFERYQPSLVVASTAGWRLDRYLLREAAARKVPTAAAIVGWDNPSSYSLSGAPMDFVTCWSEVQKEELVLGSDWQPERVHIGGIPSYDGYFRGQWLMPRQEYFRLHNLDPERKLLSYACSFVSFAPNYRNVEALARLVASNTLAAPSQLLVRLHPNHFMDVHLFAEERRRIQQLAQDVPHVHVVEPVPFGGELGYYSGEDMPEKTSMMAHSDVFLTVYSTMVVEAAIHDRPIVSVCLDTPGGWNTPRKYSLPLSRIGDWPTHLRFREAKAGRVALSEREIRDAVNAYLKDPAADRESRRAFIEREVTFKDGSAGRRTGEYLSSIAS